MKKYTLLITVIALIATVFMVGCDDRSPVAPSSEPANILKIVRISTSADSIYLDEGRTFAEISVHVEDEDNNPVVNQPVYFKKDLGKLLAVTSTDAYGIAQATFTDDGQAGLAMITAYVQSPTVGNADSLVTVAEASIPVKIVEVPDVGNITIAVKADPDATEEITNPFVNETVYVEVVAKDSQGENVPDGTVLTFRTTKGFFETNTAASLGDSVMVQTADGNAALFLNTGNGPGAVTVNIRVGVYQQTKTFTIESEAQILHIHNIEATPESIYSDNNITFSNIRVWIRDAEQFAAAGVPVKFRTDIGRIIGTVYTDSSGVATTSFWDDGYYHATDNLATIEAVVKSYSTINTATVIATDSEFVNVRILPVPPVNSVILSTLADEFRVTQKVTVTASATYTNGDDVTDNTLITFSTSLGTFEDTEETLLGNAVSVPTSNGTASIIFNTGLRADMGTISALVSDVTPASHDFVVKPGRPAILEINSLILEPNSDVIVDTTDTWPVNSNFDIVIQTKVKDAFNNKCPGAAVKFLTDLGTYESQDEEIIKNSDEDGIAKVLFTPGLEAGIANMTISANQDTLQAQYVFTVTSDDLYSISFTTDNQIDINVAGTGGQESAILSVNLRDINGNFLNNPTTLYFWIRNVSVPEGANLDNENTGWNDDPVEITSSGGIAQISVNAGSESGILSVLVSTLQEHNDATLYPTDADAAAAGAIYARKSNIVIHAGPPETIEPFIGDFNTGTLMGGGVWQLIAGANIKDTYGNPVDYGTSVWFELDRPTSVQANVVAEAYVGNESVDGDSLQGIAYTTLAYHGSNSYADVTIIANTIGGEGQTVTGNATLPLPLQQPQLEAQAMPGVLEFWPANPDGSGYAWLAIAGLNRVKLTDGQGNPINGGFISASADRGRFVNVDVNCDNGLPWDGPTYGPRTHADFVEINETANQGADLYETTYWFNQQGELDQGTAIFWWALNAYEIRPYDPNTATPGQTPAQLTFRLLGTGATANSQVMVYNYSFDIMLPN
ncbi:MAG: Ig-like domain-containing protein [Candidatus Zophobacter franzmannii]|nr:Ig-like domain-containing protein [Candidatus Zophobacter franzmannii]